MVNIECPYCHKPNELKTARGGQRKPYMRCNSCNLLIWFYGGVPKKSSPKNEVVENKSYFDELFGGV